MPTYLSKITIILDIKNPFQLWKGFFYAYKRCVLYIWGGLEDLYTNWRALENDNKTT
jgi:hypothetical protein